MRKASQLLLLEMEHLLQLVPELARDAAQLYVLQRTPNWVVPKFDPVYPSVIRWILRTFTPLRTLYRYYYYWYFEKNIYAFASPTGSVQLQVQKLLKTFINKETNGNEKLNKVLTPTYPVGCKRILLASTYYPALLKPNVELVTDAINHVQPEGVLLLGDRLLKVDALALATGFQAGKLCLSIVGRGGAVLKSVWGDEPFAYMGVTVPEFPNLFILLGPNTALGHNSVVWMIECQVDYVYSCIEKMLEENVSRIEVLPDACKEFVHSVRSSLEGTVWARSNCRSWYQSPKGVIYTLWHTFTFVYWWRMLKPNWSAYKFS